MNWAGKQHPVETLAEWCAPALFGGAIGWSASAVGLAVPFIVAAAAAALAAALLAIRLLGRAGQSAVAAFEPTSFEADVVESDELLLDDPLVEIADDSRVVRLFAAPDPTPGELLLRIEDFLDQRPRGLAAQQDDGLSTPPIPDAGAALQAALANIRASLR